MEKWKKLINNIVIILLLLFVLWGLWNNYERTMLNQRFKELNQLYEHQVEHLNEVIKEYQDYLCRFQEQYQNSD